MEIVPPISDDDNIFRRVPTHLPNYVKPDGQISSMAYRLRKGEDGISVDLERLSSYEQATLNNDNFRLLKINVGVIKNEINDGLDVIFNPLPENSAHSLITGNITKGKQKQLLKRSEEVYKNQ